MSDNRLHSPKFVQFCFNIFYNNLKERDVQMVEHFIWSYNYTGQFKNAQIFYWLNRMHREHNIQHIWSSFEDIHVKGEHNGVRTCMKRDLARKKLKLGDSVKFQDACVIMDWCNTNISTG